MNAAEQGGCELCGRRVDRLTRHANRRNKRDFDRADVTHRIAWLCRPCHDHVHAVLTEKTLEREYNTLESLREDPAIARFVRWIADKPPDFRPPMGRRMKGRR